MVDRIPNEVWCDGKKWVLEEVDDKTNFVSLVRDNASMICHKSSLSPFKNTYSFYELNLVTKENFFGEILLKRRIKKFFCKLIKRKWPPSEKMLLKITLNDKISSRLIIDYLNHYGVYGVSGRINLHFEWFFSYPTQNDEEADKIINKMEMLSAQFLHDIGAAGRKRYYKATYGTKECYVVGRLLDHRELYKNRVTF